MPALQGRIADLVSRLDALGPDSSLTTLTSTMDAVKLEFADVAPYVEENDRAYHRGVVVRREHYELLVITWRPGQGSVPHDHSGSVSAMEVIRGEALEGSWRIAADGYVDLDYEAPVGATRRTAWQDAGVHTIRNPQAADQALVTVHVYSPPLKEFRRYVPRPDQPHQRIQTSGPHVPHVVVVGGGFTGSMTAAQMLRRANATGTAIQVTLIERQGSVGEGVAYGTRDPAHLLNVPAGKMSAWPDQPDDFVNWVSQRRGAGQPADFLPRQWYGEYVRETLVAAANVKDCPAHLSVMIDEVRRIVRRPDGGWMVNFARNTSCAADAVVLAIGHRPPHDPIGKLWSGSRHRYIVDPWRPFATNQVLPDDPALILGTGLTAVDTVLSLSHESRRAPITLVSRHGFVACSHALPQTPQDLSPLVSQLLAEPNGLSIKVLFHEVRQRVRDVVAAGGNWRSVVDGLRPHTANLWRALSNTERQRFLTLLRPYWEVHRHRTAGQVANRFEELRKSGLVRIISGRVAAVQADEDRQRVYVRERGDERLREINTGWIINCTGPTASNSADSNPAIGSLLVHGRLRADALGLGLETTVDGNAIDAEGNETADLFIVGTLRKPGLWESTAVPELRSQAAAVGQRALELVTALDAGRSSQISATELPAQRRAS